MTNNDDLAQHVRLAAEHALDAWNKFLSLPDDVDLESGLSLYEMSLLSAHDAASNPSNILALLAERDADKKLIAEQDARLIEYARIATDNAKRIAELEAISSAAEKLVRCKGRYHSEQNYRALAALFGVTMPELPPLEGEAQTVSVKLPPLDDDLASILGRPNFTCSHLAELLRKSGEDIPRKSEREQAAVIYWFLGLYLEHGDKWEGVAKADIQSRVAGINLEVGE